MYVLPRKNVAIVIDVELKTTRRSLTIDFLISVISIHKLVSCHLFENFASKKEVVVIRIFRPLVWGIGCLIYSHGGLFSNY